MARKLTAKQQKFINSVLSGMTQADAYRAAYNTSKMTVESVVQCASRLMNNVNVASVLKQRQKEIENTAIWERKHALEMLKDIADADIKDFLSFKTAKTVVGHDKVTDAPIIDYAQIVDVMDSEGIDGRLIQEVSISKDGTFKFKLYDKLKAAEMANKMCGYNEPAKIEITGEAADIGTLLHLAGYKKDD